MSITIEKELNFGTKEYIKLFSLIAAYGGQARFIGGCVRDALLGLIANDIDIATDLLPEIIVQICLKNCMQVIPTGIKHGTVTVIINNEKFEVTSLRRDLYCDGRHAEVEYTNSFEEDALRRDFTINALSYCPQSKKLFDYCKGLEDIENKRVVFIGDAKQRIIEDYLRILRFFRFSCRFAGHDEASEIDAIGLRACIELKNGLKALSKERIKAEIDAIIIQPKCAAYLGIMYENNILTTTWDIIKHYDPSYLEFRAKYVNIFDKIDIKILSYSILFGQQDKIDVKTLLELRFSKAEAKLIMELITKLKLLQSSECLEYLIRASWLEDELWQEALALFMIFGPIIDQNKSISLICYRLYEELKTKQRPDFPISSEELIKLGFTGKILGSKLQELKKTWIKSNFMINKIEIMKKI